MPTVSELGRSDCATLNAVRRQYAAWRYVVDCGYIVYCRGSEKLYEHRAVAMAVWGIPDGYHVHHVNERKDDNRASNLQVLSPSEHGRVHNPSRQIAYRCPMCGRQFSKQLSKIRRRKRHYCSHECAFRGRRKVERPSRQQLATLLDQVGNWRAIGQMYGVADNTVRKWAKRYDLDLSVCDGRKSQV